MIHFWFTLYRRICTSAGSQWHRTFYYNSCDNLSCYWGSFGAFCSTQASHASPHLGDGLPPFLGLAKKEKESEKKRDDKGKSPRRKELHNRSKFSPGDSGLRSAPSSTDSPRLCPPILLPANFAYLQQEQNKRQRLPTTVSDARITRHSRLCARCNLQLTLIVDI